MVFSAIFGAGDRKAAADKQVKLQNEQLAIDDKYFNQTRRDQNRYADKGVKIARQNEQTFREYGDASALQDYKDTLKINDYQYGQQVRQFNESERIYGLQRGFNAQAEQTAMAAEARRFEEITTGMAFEQQDMLVKMLQEEGAVQARGQSGNSAKKNLASVLAGYGRNQAIMAESLVSAKKDSRGNYRQIAQDKYGADLAAESKRMLTPLRAPDPTAPLALPKAEIQKAFNIRKKPKSVKAVNTTPGLKWYDAADATLEVAQMLM